MDQGRSALEAGAPEVESRVSRETFAGLQTLVGELRRWAAIKNLVARSTLDEVWRRHVDDSLQLLDLAPPAASVWLDFGSGAGFPGLVIAIAGRDRGVRVHLVESDSRKCAFLRHVARLTGAEAQIHEARIERIAPALPRVEVVTARAVAPLSTLIGYSERFLREGACGLFPRGRSAADELTAAARLWKVHAELMPSRTDSAAGIVRIASLDDA